MRELRRGNDHRDDARRYHPDRVDDHRAFPSRFARTPPVYDHARLRQCESHEHADRVQRNQSVRFCPVQDQQSDRRGRQDENAVRVAEAVAAIREDVRRVAVARHHRGQRRQPGEARIRCQDQDQRRGDLHDVKHRSAVKDSLGDLRDDRLRLRGMDADLMREHGQRDEERRQDRRHPGQRRRGVFRRRFLERRHSVGDRLDSS